MRRGFPTPRGIGSDSETAVGDSAGAVSIMTQGIDSGGIYDRSAPKVSDVRFLIDTALLEQTHDP